MMKPKFQSCPVSRSLTTDSTRSSPTSSPAAMTRRTCAPILVWFCTFQRKMSPTLMCTRSRSAASIWLCVPLPLPWTPIMTYLRIPSAWHMRTPRTRSGRLSPGPAAAGRVRPRRGRAQPELALAGAPRPAAEQHAQLRPVFGQPARVEEPGHVPRPSLAEQDAVQLEPGPLAGHVELAHPTPGQVDREHHDPLPRAVQVLQPAGQPPAIAGQSHG